MHGSSARADWRHPLADIDESLHVASMLKAQTDRLKRWARNVKRDVVALWLSRRDPRVAWYAKATAAAVAAYALSPIDLIPDFIPILGYLDDLVIVPLGILLAIRMIPAPVMEDLRRQASALRRPTSLWGFVAVVTIWTAAASAAAWWFWTRR